MTTSGSSASLSLTSSSDPSACASGDGSREEDLRRALRHHARALKALRGSAYETLSEATRSELIMKLEKDWSELKQRLRRLNAPGDRQKKPSSVQAETASGEPSAPAATESWMHRLTSGFRS